MILKICSYIQPFKGIHFIKQINRLLFVYFFSYLFLHSFKAVHHFHLVVDRVFGYNSFPFYLFFLTATMFALFCLFLIKGFMNRHAHTQCFKELLSTTESESPSSYLTNEFYFSLLLSCFSLAWCDAWPLCNHNIHVNDWQSIISCFILDVKYFRICIFLKENNEFSLLSYDCFSWIYGYLCICT